MKPCVSASNDMGTKKSIFFLHRRPFTLLIRTLTILPLRTIFFFFSFLCLFQKMVMRGARLWSVLVGKSCNDCTRQSEGKSCQGEGGQRALSLSEEGRAVEKWRRWNSSKALWHRHRSALCGASATTSAFSQIHRDPHSQLGRSISQKSRYAISHSTSTVCFINMHSSNSWIYTHKFYEICCHI
jgi:hypothetical protein